MTNDDLKVLKGHGLTLNRLYPDTLLNSKREIGFIDRVDGADLAVFDNDRLLSRLEACEEAKNVICRMLFDEPYRKNPRKGTEEDDNGDEEPEA